MLATDTETGARFDDYTMHDHPEDYDTDAWTQVCDGCAQKLGLMDSYLETGAGQGICGVEDCENEAEHYYDFKLN
jgi:hypothetical protein|tara:strand:+ start:165 stop:389 length:225 start_codon:yes stop_codon:yes gene_type:complete